MELASVELSREDKTQEMPVVGMERVQAYQEAHRVESYPREVTVLRREVTSKEFLTNNNKDLSEVLEERGGQGDGQVEGGNSVLEEGGDICEDGGGRIDGLVKG